MNIKEIDSPLSETDFSVGESPDIKRPDALVKIIDASIPKHKQVGSSCVLLPKENQPQYVWSRGHTPIQDSPDHCSSGASPSASKNGKNTDLRFSDEGYSYAGSQLLKSKDRP